MTSMPFAEAVKKIHAAKSILVILPQNHTVDTLSAGLSLHLALTNLAKTTNQNRFSTIVSSGPTSPQHQKLFGVSDIQSSLGSKNLVITLEIDQDKIEKISHDNDNNKLNIIIETKSGVDKLTKKDTTFSYRGIDSDLIIAIGISSAQQLGSFAQLEPNLFTDRDSIFISNLPEADATGTIKLINLNASGVSEIVALLLRFMKISINADIATNILCGIESATNNFSTKTTADTFAAISWSMRLGGKRNFLDSPVNPNMPQGNSFNQAPPSFPFPFQPGAGQYSPPPSSPGSFPSFPPPASPFPNSNLTGQSPTQSPPRDQNQPSPQQDWLEPKIFKGGKNV